MKMNLMEAYRKFEMTEDEYHEGKRLVKDLMNRLEAKQQIKKKKFTDKYLERVHKEGANFLNFISEITRFKK